MCSRASSSRLDRETTRPPGKCPAYRHSGDYDHDCRAVMYIEYRLTMGRLYGGTGLGLSISRSVSARLVSTDVRRIRLTGR